jgi:hypothetical protein
MTASAIVCLIAVLFYQNRSDAVTTERSQSVAKRAVAPRLTPGQLKFRAITRKVVAVDTNCAVPFVALLGPVAANYMGGMEALRALPATLSSNQVVTLRAVVSLPYNTSMPFSALEFNGIKNVAADILLQQPAFPAEFLADLVLQHADPTQDEVWRDYCLQMLTSGYLNLSSRTETDPDAPAARELALNTLMNATTAGGPTWPGTALLGLNTILAAEPSAFPREELDKRIVAALSDASASEAALITASRLAGMSRLESARTSLEALSKSSSSELVRTAAAKSLSDLGPRTLLSATHSTRPALSDIPSNPSS